MFTRESGLIFRTFEQYIFKMFYQRGWGSMKKKFGNSRGEGGGGIFLYKNGNSGEVGGSYLKFPLWWDSGYFLKPHN